MTYLRTNSSEKSIENVTLLIRKKRNINMLLRIIISYLRIITSYLRIINSFYDF